MTKKVMVLKIREFKKFNFYEKQRADLFNDDEMKKLTRMATHAIMCGLDVKVELQEMEV